MPPTVAKPWASAIHWSVLGLSLAAGLVVRALYANVCKFLSVDSVYYLLQAQKLVETGHLSVSSFPPGWPLLTAPFLLFLNIDDPMAPLRAAQMANVIFGTVFGLLTFLMLSRSCNRWLALIGAMVILLLPQNIQYSKGAMSEMSYACVMLGAWLFLERKRFFWTGLFLGYAYLIRPEALIIAFGIGVIHLVQTRKIPWAFVGGLFLVLVPYVVFLKMETGHWTLSAKLIFLENAQSQNLGLKMFDLVGSNIATLLKRLVILLGLPLILLVPLGCLAPKRSWLLFMAPLLTLPFFDFDMMQRFWLPYVPFMLMGFFLGVHWVTEKAPLGIRRFVPVVLFLVSAGGLGHRIVVDFPVITYVYESFYGLKEAGLWLRENIDSETKVAAYKPYVRFWSGCGYVKINREETAAIAIDKAYRAGARYLVINTKVTLYNIPMMKPLLVSPLPAHLDGKVKFVKLFQYENDPYQNTAIYAITGN